MSSTRHMSSMSPSSNEPSSSSDGVHMGIHIEYTITDAFKAAKSYDVAVIKKFIRQRLHSINKEHMELGEISPTKGQSAVNSTVSDTVRKALAVELDSRDERGATMLHWACYSGAFDITKILISFGANPNYSEFDGKTPLHWAAFEGYYEICEYLLNKVPDINPLAEEESGLTPCHLAVMGKHDDVARLFSNHGDVMSKSLLLLSPIEILVDDDTSRDVSGSLEPYQMSEDDIKRLDNESQRRKRKEEKRRKKHEKEKLRQALMDQLVVALVAQKTAEKDISTEVKIKWKNDEAENLKLEERQRRQRFNKQKKIESAYLIRKRALIFSRGKPPWKPPPRNHIDTDVRDIQHAPLSSPLRYRPGLKKQIESSFISQKASVTGRNVYMAADII